MFVLTKFKLQDRSPSPCFLSLGKDSPSAYPTRGPGIWQGTRGNSGCCKELTALGRSSDLCGKVGASDREARRGQGGQKDWQQQEPRAKLGRGRCIAGRSEVLVQRPRRGRLAYVGCWTRCSEEDEAGLEGWRAGPHHRRTWWALERVQTRPTMSSEGPGAEDLSVTRVDLGCGKWTMQDGAERRKEESVTEASVREGLVLPEGGSMEQNRRDTSPVSPGDRTTGHGSSWLGSWGWWWGPRSLGESMCQGPGGLLPQSEPSPSHCRSPPFSVTPD